MNTEKYLVSGARPSVPDIRDYRYVPKIPVSEFAPSIDLRVNSTAIEDQLSAGACAAEATTSLVEWLAKSWGVQPDIDLSSMGAYRGCKWMEGRLLEDGLGVRDIFKYGRKYGFWLESEDPYDVSMQYTKPSDELFGKASIYIDRYERICSYGDTSWIETDKLNYIKGCLNERFPVGAAMMVTASLRNLTGPWKTHQYRLAAQDNYKQEIGGHMFKIVGYDISVQMFICQNSWGAGYGDNGYFGLPFAVVNESFFEAWMVRQVARYNDFGIKTDTWGLREPAGIYFEEVNRFEVLARIVPTDAELGTTVNVYVGARRPDPTAMDGYGPLIVQRPDKTWVNSAIEIPAFNQITLQEDNPIKAVSIWDDQFKGLSPYSGTKVFMAYGQSPETWKTKLLCTVPQYA